MRIGIIGAGHAGLALFACIHQSGSERPKIFSHPDHSIRVRQVLEQGGRLTLQNRPAGTSHVAEMETTDLVTSVSDLAGCCDLIFNTTPVNAHDGIFEELLQSPGRWDGSLTYVNLGGGFSVFRHMAAARSARRELSLGTFHTLPYASRATATEIQLLNVRQHTSYAFQGGTGSECIALLKQLFPSHLEYDDNMLHMSLDRSSYVMHPLLTIFNANRIDNKEDFFFYRDGFCNSVRTLLIRAGVERQELAHALGFRDYPDPVLRLANFERNYGEDFKTIRPPTSLQHRYIYEDIPYGLVPICGLGDIFGLPMPVNRALVDIAGAVAGQDLWDSPYNLSRNPVLQAAFLQGQRVTLRRQTQNRVKSYEAAV